MHVQSRNPRPDCNPLSCLKSVAFGYSCSFSFILICSRVERISNHQSDCLGIAVVPFVEVHLIAMSNHGVAGCLEEVGCL